MLLRWYQTQAKEHGAIAATRLLSRVVVARGTTTLVNKLLPPRVSCPCCDWEGRRFHHYIEAGLSSPDTECPQCNSHPRHRELYLWLTDEFHLADKSGVGLIFAPERALNGVWERAPNLRAYKIDIEASRGVDVLADMQRLPFESDSIDFIWCHHVLQLIEDDRAAIRELRRVLCPVTGEAAISVAIARQTQTHEFGSANKDLLYFWRMYGDDFAERLAEEGLTARPVNYHLSAEQRRRYGAGAQDGFYLCSKKDYS
jgi:SAM-dependent methyltransferase